MDEEVLRKTCAGKVAADLQLLRPKATVEQEAVITDALQLLTEKAYTIKRCPVCQQRSTELTIKLN